MSAPTYARQVIRDVHNDILAAGEVLRHVGTHIPEGCEAVPGTWLVWIGRMLNHSASELHRAYAALDAERKA